MTGPVYGTLFRSEFDSEIFGVPFYRVRDPGAADLGGEVAALKESGRFIADLKLAPCQPALEARLARLGFRRAATMIALEAPAGGARPDSLADELILGGASMEAHANGFVFSRFAQDPLAPPGAAARLMAAWIRNSLAGRRRTLADGRNFCTYDVAEGALTIDLLSSIDQGRGSAGRLLAGVRAIAAAEGATVVRVVTEGENAPALRVYIRAGFSPIAAEIAMHLHYSGAAS